MSNVHRPNRGRKCSVVIPDGLLQRLSWTIEDSSQTFSHPTETLSGGKALVVAEVGDAHPTTCPMLPDHLEPPLLPPTPALRRTIHRIHPIVRPSWFDVVSVTVTLSVSGSGGLFVSRGAGSQ